MERAFEGHLDMVSRDIEKINGTSFQHVETNLLSGLRNAFEMVTHTDLALSLIHI